jgi:DNA-binding response OmpR family regulator
MLALVADDVPGFRLFHGTVLRQLGHEVIEAPDGHAAWEAIRTHRPALAILDWFMPGLDGLEVVRRVRQDPATRETFVLLVTVRDDEPGLLDALKAGVDDYCPKSLGPDALMARLRICEARIAARADRRAYQEALSAARHLAGVAETCGTVQHEINNPLTALLGHVQLLREGLLPAEEQDAALAEVATQAERIAEVLRQLRELKVPRSVAYDEGLRMLDLSPPRE